jgi:RNA polymerase sigma-70 factor (ECF subfamily)
MEREVTSTATAPRTASRAQDQRLRAMVEHHFDFIWRSLRRLGVPAGSVDDAAQQVFLVASSRMSDIADGAEKSFLFQTAVRVASDARRARARRPEQQADSDGMVQVADQAPGPEELADRKRARALLDEVLEGMDMELRTVFVLFEIEGLAQPDIAAMLGIPTGTCASRLRRAREDFQAAVKRLQARQRRST